MADLATTIHETIGQHDGPGRYRIEDEWDDTECYLTVVGKVEDDT